MPITASKSTVPASQSANRRGPSSGVHTRKTTKRRKGNLQLTADTRRRHEQARARAAAAGTTEILPPGTSLRCLRDAAERLGISVWTLRREIYAGRIAHHLIGRKPLVSDAELDRIIAESLIPAA